MKVAKSATGRVSTRPVHQIQFDEGTDSLMGQKTDDLKKRGNGCSGLSSLVLFYTINHIGPCLLFIHDEWRSPDLSLRKNMLKGKRLNIFYLKTVTEEAPKTGLLRT
uniref:Uncharacterized protein n=1 Tax=Mustela putorius furo TaxID=9669 RepID=M3YEF9_MUSPF